MRTFQHLFQSALRHHQAGRLREAEHLYRQVLDVESEHADAIVNLGSIAYQTGRPELAISLFRRAIALRPADAETHVQLGDVLTGQGELAEAIRVYSKAAVLQPDSPVVHCNLGNALREKGEFDAAEAACRRAIAISPAYAPAHNNLGNALLGQKRIDEAIAAYRQAIALSPGYADAHSNLGVALKDKGDISAVIAALRRAIELVPDFADAHNNLGNALKRGGELDEAIAAYRHAIALKPGLPDAHYNLATALLSKGDFFHGWEEYEWRWESEGIRNRKRNFAQPQWDGSPFNGRTLLLHAEQGFGDAIQFIRYLPLVRARGRNVIVECPPALERLFRASADGWQVVVRGKPLPAFDLYCPLLSLPRTFQTTLENLPGTTPYLKPDAGEVKRWRLRLAETGGMKVGVVWAGRPTHDNDSNRSLALAQLAPLGKVPGVRFFSLQVGAAAAQAIDPPMGMSLVDQTKDLKDFADTAALIANLDLIIAVDTAVAHLAGAIGKPAWVLLPFAAEWRWMLEGEDSPWYPTMRLFRQTSPGDWAGVIDRVAIELSQAVASRSNEAEAHNYLGRALRHAGRLDEAIAAYRQALACCPGSLEAHLNLGNALQDAGRLDQAAAAFRDAITLRGDYAEAHNNLGNVLLDAGHLDEAIDAFQRAATLKPAIPELRYNLGNALGTAGRHAESIACYREALALRPDYPDAIYNLGNALESAGQLDEAIPAFHQAIALRPAHAESHYNLALALLRQGDFKQAWEQYEWRWKCRDFPSPRRTFAQPQWDGRNMPGATLLLHAEQGFGDTLQFIRYLPLVAPRVGTVVVECQPELKRLFEANIGGHQVIARGQPLPPFDLHCPLLSLAGIFGTTATDPPGGVPYIRAAATDSEMWRRRMASHSPAMNVGLAWAGSPTHKNNRNRSIALAMLAPLPQTPGVRFFTIQTGAASAEASNPPPEMDLINWAEDLRDFADTAGLVANLDLVIAVDTAVAHLAGAMGKPVWVLLPFVADWRWLKDRRDSPWYPSMRLFRQPAEGDWNGAIRALADELARLAQKLCHN